eukprot:scaffold718_cov342-Pavlova_lutheri.AAC.29
MPSRNPSQAICVVDGTHAMELFSMWIAATSTSPSHVPFDRYFLKYSSCGLDQSRTFPLLDMW